MAAGQPDMQQLLAQAQKMQQQMMEAQDALAQATVTGTSGGGLVTATASGTGELLDLSIDPEAVDPHDTGTLADLVVAAVRDANRAAGELQSRTLGPLTEGLGGESGLGLPGMERPGTA